VHRGRARQDPERGQGRLRARGADRLVGRTWDTDGAHWPGGRAVVAGALCRDEGGRLSRGAARDTSRAGRLQGHAGQDRSHRRPRHRPADAAGLVSGRALQIAAGPGGAGASDHPHAPAGQAPGCRDEPARRAARLWAKGWADHAQDL
jgi:hypothetical protein